MKLRCLILWLALGVLTAASQTLPRREVRAVWLTTLSGLDWPSRQGRSVAVARAQQQELCQTLDALKRAGINTVLLQTRVRGTVIYPSAIEPWDAAFCGTAGVAPAYDPLQFALDECHKRGMELHAWVVAFPLCKVATARTLGAAALPRRHPALCRRAGDTYMMDPGVPETAEYLAALCREIAAHYAVDGVHLDYIRYPEHGIPWDDRATYRRYAAAGQTLQDFRRASVTRCVRRIAEAVRAVRPAARISCSPVGKRCDLPRQSSYGWNARDAVAQDAAEWLRQGWMDILFPMMYFDGKHFYPFAQDWQEQVAAAGRGLVVPGLGIYFLSPQEKDWLLSVITRQLHFTRALGMGGAAFFRSRFLTSNVKGLADFLTADFYAQPALSPALSPADTLRLAPQHLRAEATARGVRLTWQAVESAEPLAEPIYYNVYRLPAEGDSPGVATLVGQRLSQPSFVYLPALPALRHARFCVTAIDAFGRESHASSPVSL